MMRSANDIAEWIVRYGANELGAPIDPMSLQKLAYYAQAFHLAIQDRPLFREDIQAWKWGPVISSVYKRYAGYGSDPIVLPDDGPPHSLSDDDVENFLSQIVGFFCQHTATKLSRATHLEEPWIDAHDLENNVIEEVTIRDYYRALMDEGERALSRNELLDTISDPRWASYYVAGISLRRMTAHPFYEPSLAKKLAESPSPKQKLPKSFFAPARGRDFVEFPSDEDSADIIRRVVSPN